MVTPFLFSGMASGVHQATKTGSSLLQSGSSPWKWPRTRITFWSPNLNTKCCFNKQQIKKWKIY
jgi:hypothetical protein